MDKPFCRDKHGYFKVYGSPKKVSDNYYEVPFVEYRANGERHRTGVEDFSSERLKSIPIRHAFRWNGREMPSGHRYTNDIGSFRVSPNAYIKRVAEFLFGEIERVS